MDVLLLKFIYWHVYCRKVLQMNKYTIGEIDMQTEPYPQILTEREIAIFFNLVIHTANYVMEKAENLSAEGRKSLLEEFRKKIAESQ